MSEVTREPTYLLPAGHKHPCTTMPVCTSVLESSVVDLFYRWQLWVHVCWPSVCFDAGGGSYSPWRSWGFMAVLVSVQNEKEILFGGRVFFFTNIRRSYSRKICLKIPHVEIMRIPLCDMTVNMHLVGSAACERCLPFDGTLEPCWDLPTGPFVLEC